MSRLITACAISALLLLIACGGGHPALDSARTGAPGPSSPASGPGSSLPGLGALDKLPPPAHGVSALAPGFHNIKPLETLSSANSSDGGGFLLLDNSAANTPTFAVYGVYGFDGDNYPVSVQLDTTGSTGKFYLAFSDYVLKRWQIRGPFNAGGEFGIPLLTDHSSPTAFTSPAHTNFFAVIVPDGSKAALHVVQLGVSGGHNSPQPIFLFGAKGGVNGLLLQWNHSYSYKDPDFAGYIVERAPEFGGAFAPLSASPASDPYFLDTTAVVNTVYRYRIATYDTSGNEALSLEAAAGAQDGDLANPVARLDLPDGPLYGPVQVTFDLASSFDPEGVGITTYEINYFGSNTLSAPGPQATVTLQPGCYIIEGRVVCADLREGTTYRILKVYPQWQAANTVVRATDPTMSFKEPRIYNVRGGILPADGKFTLAGYDATLPGLSFWRFTGGQMVESRVRQIEFVNNIGEPVPVGGQLVFPITTPYNFMLASFDGSSTTVESLAQTSNSYAVALAADAASSLWYSFSNTNGVLQKVYLEKTSGGTENELATVASAPNYIDLVFEPGSGHFFVFYENGMKMDLTEWDPGTQTAIGTTTLGNGNIYGIDAEINPENGHVAVLYNADSHSLYREQDGLGGWTAPQEVDNSALSNGGADLMPGGDGHLCAYFSLFTKQAYLYTLSGTVWTRRNTVSFSADSGYELTLLPIPASADVRVADEISDGGIKIARLNANGSDAVTAAIDTAIGQGIDMHAAGGTDGLHVIWQPVNDLGVVQHVLSASGPDEGSVWANATAFPAEDGLNLRANDSGDIYATGFHSLADHLEYWDSAGGNFVDDQSFPALSAHRPVLGTDTNSDTVYFAGWDAGANTFHYITGQHGSYAADSPYAPFGAPIWDAVFNQAINVTGFDYIAGSPQDTPRIGFGALNDTYLDSQVITLLPKQASPFDKPSLDGRLIDASIYMSGFTEIDAFSSEAVVAQGDFVHPVRIDTNILGAVTVTELPLGVYAPDYEPRRTVSAGLAHGRTAVNLVATIGGEETHFEWSNLGHWETLPLPPGLDNISMPIISVGQDGRWHIIYKDWKTDSIMCRSTL